jgi:hypothetical protein
MTFTCIESDTKRYIGDCTLPNGQYDPYGTEHMFGEVEYVLQSTHIYENNGTMYFKRK